MAKKSEEIKRQEAIAEHACRRYSGRIGRTAAAKDLDERALHLAVRAHVRHRETEYDRFLAQGADRESARAVVGADVERVLESWRQER